MKYIGLLGYPLSHSISPAFQQVALDYYKLDVVYQSWERTLDELSEVIKGARALACLGMNVTIPYKTTVASYLDSLDRTAQEIKAVNTIVNLDKKLKGYNTDAAGFLKALKQDGSFNPAGKKAAILGCGGAGRAAAYALCWGGIKELLLLNRTLDKSESLKKDLTQYPVNITVAEWDLIAEQIHSCDLIVNCTSMGMKNNQEQVSPLKEKQIPRTSLVFDIVYNPRETILLKEANKAGAKTLNGLSMLVYQGAEAFQLWTGLEPPIDVMFKSAREALGKI